MTKLSIVILTFNSSGFIKTCLDSVFKQRYQDLEVILIDNGSSDDTLSLVRNDYPGVRLIENKINLGAAKAKNQGIEASKGEWVLTLDCDVVLEKDSIGKIMGFAGRSDKAVGIIQPKILQKDRRRIYSCGAHLSSSRRFYDIGKGKVDNGKFNKERNVFGACCAAALYRKKMLEEVKDEHGYFDERFFFLVEDVDLAWKAQRKGWKAMFLPDAACYHAGNSSNYDRKFRQYLCFRNRYRSISKNEGFGSYSKKVFPLLFYDVPRYIYMLFSNPYMFNFTYRFVAQASPTLKRKVKPRMTHQNIPTSGIK